MQQIGVGFIQIGVKDREYVNQVLDSARLSYGPFTQKFEAEFAKQHDSKFAIFCNSGTSALQVALNALKIKYGYKEGDEVIVPALTFVATVNIVLQNGLKPVLVDVDPDFYELDVDKIEEKITPRTRAIIPVHVGGLPCDMEKVMQIAKKHNLQVIEDSCETMLSTQNNKKVGSFGEIGCFSTYVAHVLTTGVGGFVTTNDKELATLCKSLFNHGRNNVYLSIDDDKGKTQSELQNIISKRFSFDYVGYSYRATELEGAIGLAQLEILQENIDKRIKNAEVLSYGLTGLPLQLPKERPNTTHCYMFYPIVVNEDVNRENLVNFLEENHIETRYLLPLTNQPVYKGLFTEDDYPVAKELNERAFYIACHPGLTREDIGYMVSTIWRYFQ